MEKQRRKIATLGVSAHDDVVLKSILQLVAGRTRVVWEFCDDIDADVVLCEPSSALAAIAVRRAAEGSGPVCVALVRSGQPSSPSRTLHLPLRASEVFPLLEELGGTPRATPTPAPAGDAQFGAVLRRLCSESDATPRAVRIATRIGALSVALPERLHLADVIDETFAARLAAYRGPVAIESLDGDAARAVRRDARLPLEPVLWQCGLVAPPEKRPANARWRLRRWPDFGRAPPTDAYLALAAALAARAATVDELATRARTTADTVRAFLTACAYCGLLEAAAETPPPPRVASRGWGGVVRQLRNALGLAAS